MKIRSNSWGDATISWSLVIEELLYAAAKRGHETHFITTNGYKGMKYITEEEGLRNEIVARKLDKAQTPFDLDLTYTAPLNFSKRFSPFSKKKMAIYAYESSIMPSNWKEHYKYVDFMLPPSEYCADMMIRNGCPKEKVVVVPHGIHLEQYHPGVEPFKLKTQKRFKFLCIGEPHHRKQIDRLLDLYCKTFSKQDDVVFVLKTKLFRTAQAKSEMTPFEMDLMRTLVSLKKEYGENMPEITVIHERIPNIASLYTACDAFVLMTAGEGWCMPYLEAQACGIPVVAPNYGGQLQFLNEENAFLTKCGERLAKKTEQYWQASSGAKVGNPDEIDFADKMRQLYDGSVKDEAAKKVSKGLETARQYTWSAAFEMIEKLC